MFLLVNFIQSLLLPTVASALTSGPTAPEATSFEPVDTTDMVNLQTGDLTYNMPLLEVPGPEGGYPLSLAYHAGIKPLEDASWVGLGWSLSPGAINRVVNGYADDHKEVDRTVEDFWEGGETHYFSVNVGVGRELGVGGSLSFGISNDTYRGFGGEASIGISNGLVGTSFSGGSTGFNFNGVSFSASRLGKNQAFGFGGNMGVNGASLGFSHSSGVSMGVKMGSSGLKPSFSIAGASVSSINNNKGRISTGSYGLSVPITPIVSVGYRYLRYWMEERDVTTTYGTLYAANSDDNWQSVVPGHSAASPGDNSFDSYSILPSDADLTDDKLDVNKEMGGALPSYDRYQISGQGLSGQIEPLILESGGLFNKKSVTKNNDGTINTVEVDYKLANTFSKKVNFRFLNDFSNKHKFTTLPEVHYQNFGSSIQYYYQSNGVVEVDKDYSYQGYNSSDQHLAGSKHIEWFTNGEIESNDNTTNAKSKGFIDYSGGVINRNSKSLVTEGGDGITFHLPSINPVVQYNVSDNIGGFSVTNESGVTYHYALPVYSYDEIHYARKIDQDNGDTWNKQDNPTPYAYSWLLTGITGPDFIDKNNNGVADATDWGYWVNFNYGKWVDDYQWRTPFEGFSKDINSGVESYSYGKKEVYYLDAIQTRTHTALFIKDIRHDAKAAQNERDGGFEPYEKVIATLYCDEIGNGEELAKEKVIANHSKSSMALERVVLLKNQTINNLSNGLEGIKSAAPNNYSYQKTEISTPICGGNSTAYTSTNTYFGNNVIDKNDFSLISQTIQSNILKSIEFDTDYSLCPETANSFDSPTFYNNHNTTEKHGKLTLNSVIIKGQNNLSIIPPINFEYDLSNPLTSNCTVNSSSQINISNSGFKAGDIVKIENGNNDAYAVLLNENGNTFDVDYLGKNELSSGSYSLKQTKNPPFSQSKHDYWGYYKSDCLDEGLAPTDYKRLPTSISEKNVDAWSLRTIENSLGNKLKIEYGSKGYDNVVLQKKNRLNISNITANSSSLVGANVSATFEFHENVNLNDYFSLNEQIPVHIPVIYYPYGSTIMQHMDYSLGTVTNITSNQLTVSNLTLGVFLGSGSLGSIQQGGIVELSESQSLYGNGPRVDNIAILDNNIETKKTIYTYQNGVTSYTPASVSSPIHEDFEDWIPYKKVYYENYYNLMKVANVVPVPGVMYQNVSITHKANGIDVPGRTNYEFKVFDASMVDNISETTDIITTSNGIKKRTHVIKDKTAQIGNLIRVELLNGEDQIVNATINDYADDGFALTGTIDGESDYQEFNDQGILQQSFSQVKAVDKDGTLEAQAIITAYKKYPNILIGTQNIQNGITTITQNKAFDFYTGEAIEVETENSYGEKFLVKSIPAYQKYPAMGLKVNNINNKHMLTQNTFTSLEKVNNAGNSIGIVSASVTTWNDSWQYRDAQNSDLVWRKHKSYIYQAPRNDANGTFSGTFEPFDWAATPHSNWKKASEITLYDHYSKPLEVKDINGNYAATKMGFNETVVIASVANAKYSEFAYASAENGSLNGNILDGEIQVSSGTLSTDYAHTGKQSLKTSGEGYLFSGIVGSDLEAGRRYRASVWVKSGNMQASLGYRLAGNNGLYIDVTAQNADIQAGEWKLLILDFVTPATGTATIEVYTDGNSNITYFDDFRFHPLDAPMTAFVYYENTGQLSHTLDAENFFTEYHYDIKESDNTPSGGRLHKVYRESTEVSTGKRLVTKHDMEYERDLN